MAGIALACLVIVFAFHLTIFTGEWSISRFGSPDLNETAGFLQISGNRGASGVLFERYDLDHKAIYCLGIEGSRKSGMPVLRIRRNAGPYQYLPAPNGRLDLMVEGTSELEVLVFSEHPFSYQTHLVLRECADCPSDKTLRDIITSEAPDSRCERKPTVLR